MWQILWQDQLVINRRNPCTKFIAFTYVHHERVYSFNVTWRNLYSRKLNSSKRYRLAVSIRRRRSRSLIRKRFYRNVVTANLHQNFDILRSYLCSYTGASNKKTQVLGAALNFISVDILWLVIYSGQQEFRENDMLNNSNFYQ